MSTAQLIPMWSTPVIGGFAGAAQFGSTSTITLESRVPNIFGNDGDYVEFMIFQSSASAWTVFGSTVSPDAIIINDNTITITDGSTSDSITLLASLSTTEWNHIRLLRNGSTIECYVATGGESLVLELQTLDVIPIDIDIIGKNTPEYSDVYSIDFDMAQQQFLSKSSPTTAIQGADTGFWRFVAFELTEAGTQTIADNLNGNDGWRIEVVNIYFSTHRLRFTVGNGNETVSLDSEETFAIGDTVFAYVDLEDLGETSPDVGDTTIEGTFSPYATNVYVGSTAGTSRFAGMKLKTFLGGDGNLSSTEQVWLINSGSGRSFDEITAVSEVATSEVDFGYTFSESSGTRADAFGSDDLTENEGYVIGPGIFNGDFETDDGGTWLENWSRTIQAGTSTFNREASTVNNGTYAARADIDASNSQARIVSDVTLESGKGYTYSVYVGASSIVNAPVFRLNDGSNAFDRAITSTSYTQYTGSFTGSGSSALYLRPLTNCQSISVYFDDLSIKRTEIDRAYGLNQSNLNAAAFSGYLKNVTINTELFATYHPLYQNANDYGDDGNHGTALSITFVETDPAT